MSDTATLTPLEAPRRRLTTVAAIDVCGYARLAESDEAAAIRTVQLVAQVFGEIVARRRGRIFHRAGDGFLAEFPSASDGVLAAIELVDEMRKRDTLSPIGVAAKVRAGVHVGDVVDQPNGDLLGHGVNVAARLQAEAEPGGVLVSLHAVNLVRDKIDVAFRRRGPLALKNIDEPVVAFDAGRENAPRPLLGRLVRRVFSTKGASAAAVLVIVLLLGLNFVVLQAVGNPQGAGGSTPSLESRTESLLLNIAPKRTGYLDEMYLHRVLSDLAASRSRSDSAVAALIESNNVDGAIQRIEESLREPRLQKVRRSQLLHQVGALSYERRPDKAIAVYEEALRLDARDFFAALRLGRAHALQDDIALANEYYDRAIKIGSPDERSILELQTHRAALFMHRYDMKGAIEILRAVIERAVALDIPPLVSRARTSLGQALLVEGRADEAKSELVAAMALQRADATDPEAARSAGVMGAVLLREGDLDGALVQYTRQYVIEKKLGRSQGLSNALYSIGDAQLAKNLVNEAQASFDEGLRIATENRLADLIFQHRVGLAQVADARGEHAAACDHVKSAESAYNGQSAIGPRTRAILEGLGCGFAPLAMSR